MKVTIKGVSSKLESGSFNFEIPGKPERKLKQMSGETIIRPATEDLSVELQLGGLETAYDEVTFDLSLIELAEIVKISKTLDIDLRKLDIDLRKVIKGE